MRKMIIVLFSCLCLALQAEPVPNKRLAPPHKDQKGPQLGAVFRNRTYFPVYRKGETVALNCYVKDGELKEPDTLVWKLFDWRKTLLNSGRIAVSPETMKQALDLEFKPERAGCYFVELKLEKSGITVPWEGSRPRGYVTFGILPELEALPLKSPEESRFGMNGITNIEQDKYAPLGTTLGIHWADNIYYPWRREKVRGEFKEVSKERIGQIWDIPYEKSQIPNLRSAARHKIAMLNFIHGLPHHLVKVPEELKGKKIKMLESAYIYNDPAYYRDLIGRMVRTTRNYRETKLNYMTRSRYLIHWEPDWHWRGTTDEFLQMYRDASRAIRENDPAGMLLGTNHGVIARAVPRMRELFQKGLADYIQGVAVHLYFLPIRSLPEDRNLHGDCRELRKLTDRYLGKNAPLMNTEWGTCAVKTLLVDHPLLLNHMYRFIRGHLIALGEGFNTTYLFYSTDYNFVNYPDRGEHGYGMTFNLSRTNFGGLNSQPKPTYMAAAAMTRLLEGTKTLGRLDYLDPEIFAYTFRRGTQNLLAVWSPYGKRTVSFRTGTGSVTGYDVMGNPETVRTPGGRLTIQADEYPRYFLGIADRVLPTAPRTAASLFRAPVMELTAGSPLSETLRSGGPGAQKLTYRLIQSNRDPLVITNGRLPEQMASGAKRLDAFDGNGTFLESMILNVTSPVQITKIDDIPEKNGSLSAGVHITNRSAGSRAASVQLSYKGQPGPVKQVVLNPGETKVVPFDVTRLYEGLPLADLSAAAFTEHGIETEHIRPSWGVSAASRFSPGIDGNLSEWPREKFSPVIGKRALARLNGWKGEEDFSVRWQTAANAQGICIALEVTDDIDYFKTDLKKPWLADSVMFAIGLDSDRRGSWERIRFFSVGRDGKGETVVHSMIGLPPDQELHRIGKEVVNAVVKRDEKRKKTVYEIQIPWETIGGKVSAFGLGIAVEDADREDDVLADRHREINLMGGIPFFMSRALMSTVVTEQPCD